MEGLPQAGDGRARLLDEFGSEVVAPEGRDDVGALHLIMHGGQQLAGDAQALARGVRAGVSEAFDESAAGYVDAGHFVVQELRMLDAVERHQAHQHGQAQGLVRDCLVAFVETGDAFRLEDGLAEREAGTTIQLALQHANLALRVGSAHVECTAYGEGSRLAD